MSPVSDPNTLLVKRYFRSSSKCWNHFLIFRFSISRRMYFVHQLWSLYSVKTDKYSKIIFAPHFSNIEHFFLLVKYTRALLHGTFFQILQLNIQTQTVNIKLLFIASKAFSPSPTFPWNIFTTLWILSGKFHPRKHTFQQNSTWKILHGHIVPRRLSPKP